MKDQVLELKYAKIISNLNKNVQIYLFKKYAELIFENFIGGQEIQVADY